MKKLIIFICFAPLLMVSQDTIFNISNMRNGLHYLSVAETEVTGNLTVTGDFIYEEDHAFLSYVTTGNDTIGGSSPGNDVILTRWACGKFDLTLNDIETHGFTLIATDTLRYDGTLPAHIKFDCSWTVTGASNNDYELGMFNVTDAPTAPIGTRTGRTTGGAANLTGITIMAYDVNADPGDKYVMKIRNRTNNDDLTFFYGIIFAEVIHFE